MKMTMTNYGLVQMEEVLIYMIHTPISLPIFLRPTEDKVASIAKISEKELMVSLYTKGIFIFNKITGTYRPFTIVDEGTNYKECFYGYLPLAHQVANDKIYIISYRPWVYHPLSGKNSL